MLLLELALSTAFLLAGVLELWHAIVLSCHAIALDALLNLEHVLQPIQKDPKRSKETQPVIGLCWAWRVACAHSFCGTVLFLAQLSEHSSTKKELFAAKDTIRASKQEILDTRVRVMCGE